MQKILPVAVLAAALTGCTTSVGSYGTEVEPIPGSITYGGQPRTRLTKSPVGSSIRHQFYNQRGQRVEEVYVLQPDRSLKLVSRVVYREWIPGGI